MEVKLENLIEKIKKEGVDAAKKQAEEIIAGAKKEAQQILDKAVKEAADIKTEAEKEAQSFKVNAEASISQAARDTVLSLKEKIKDMFNSVLINQTGAAFDEGFMKDLIWRVVDTWAQGQDVSVLAGGIDIERLKGMLASDMKKDMEVKLDNRISKGFKIGVQGDNLTYDLTDESVSEALKLFLNPKLSELLS